jgi:SCP-2 sterol transfer family protein
VIVPTAPERFLVEFLPAFVADIGGPSTPGNAGGAVGGASDARRARRPAGAGIAVRVVGVGEWTLHLAERALRVSPGMADDVALQLSVSARDFEPLVVEPTRRALATSDGVAAPERALAARGLWTRLGRFDDETADLLRRQEGRILVRVDDAGTSRNVALTPGLQPYSLDSAECCIDCEIAALEAVQEKRKNPLDLFYEGQIRITGDAQIALAMAGLFL